MTEKLASSEIAQSRERFEKVFAEKRELDVTPNTTAYAAELPYADIVTQDHFDCWQAAERDTRERCAQIVEDEDIDELIKQPFSLAEIWQALAERIRGKE